MTLGIQAFAPSTRIVSDVTNSKMALITTENSHGYNSGESVRLYIPVSFGMQGLFRVLASIFVINETQFQIPVDTVNLGIFKTPSGKFTEAHCVPVGDNNNPTNPTRNIINK